MNGNTGLTLPQHVGIGAQQEGEISQTWETIDNVEYETSRAGLPPMEMPRHVCPTLTHEMLMGSTNEQYTEVQLMIKAWKDYVADRFGRIKARQVECVNEMGEIERATRMTLSQQQIGKKKTDPDYLSKEKIQDIIESQPRYIELRLRLQILQQEEYVTEPRLSALGGDLRIISRVVELRRQEWEEGRSQSGQPRTRPAPYQQPAGYPTPGRIPGP